MLPLLLTLLLAAGPSTARVASRSGVGSPYLNSVKFAPCGSFASGAGGATVTRATSARFDCGGSEQTAGNDVGRITDTPALGLLVEPTRTQYLTTPDNAPTQTITLPVANSFYAWMEGTGSAQLTAGAATTSGLPCTINTTTGCTFNVTGSGTVTFTKTGTITFAQIEYGGQNPGFKTSRIHSATARNADLVQIVNPAPLGTPQCACARFRQETDRSWAGWVSVLMSGGTPSAANSIQVMLSSGYIYFDTFDGSAALRRLQYPVSHWADNSQQSVCVCVAPGCVQTLWVNGLQVTGTSSGTGVCTGLGTPLTLGGKPDLTYMLGGVVSDPVVLRSTAANKAFGVTLQPYQIAALGDSITQMGSPAYIVQAATNLGSAWKARNDGVSGQTTVEMLPRWWSDVRPSASGTFVMLAGINDVRLDVSGVSSAATIARLREIYDSALATGMRLVPMTILPFKGDALYTAQRNTDRQTINTWILGYCAAHGITCVDSAADFDDGTGTLKAAYDSGDHLHPSQTGYNRLATLIRAVLP